MTRIKMTRRAIRPALISCGRAERATSFLSEIRKIKTYVLALISLRCVRGHALPTHCGPPQTTFDYAPVNKNMIPTTIPSERIVKMADVIKLPTATGIQQQKYRLASERTSGELLGISCFRPKKKRLVWWWVKLRPGRLRCVCE